MPTVELADAAFVPALLTELRADHYSPAAWLHFLDRSFRRSVEDAQNEPGLSISVVRQTALLEALSMMTLLRHWRRFPSSHRLRQAGRTTLLVFLQQTFIALHLGMAQAEHGAPRFATLGAATFLTSLRGVCATLLLATDRRDLPLFGLALAVGAGADVADGAVARWSAGQSRLGHMLDPMADVCFYGTAVLVAVRLGALPRWFGGLVLARFLMPTGAGLYRYFRRAETLDAAHTAWGKLAALLLTGLIALGLRSPRAARTLCLPAAAVLIAAGTRQVERILDRSDQT